MEEFIKHETALIAKEKGFNTYQPTFYDITGDFHKSVVAGYDFTFSEHNVVAPTQAVLQKWLREGKGIHVYSLLGVAEQYFYKIHNRNFAHGTGIESRLFKTYEEALEEGLLTALKQIN